MTLSEELSWRGFINQTTYKDVSALDGAPITFYWGVDPSAASMTIGNLAPAMMVKHFIKHGHKAVLLVGGATGLIGDPDGKADERNLKTLAEIDANKKAIAAEYKRVFDGQDFILVDNYDWFSGLQYLNFLRDVGKHVPMRQMLQRDFVQSRLGESGAGISYAEFSYALIQAYDFLHLYKQHGVTLQVCGSDQWGNSIAGVDLIRRVTGGETHVWSTPLIINKATGKKFGKSEGGAVWLDPKLTTPTQFYQFWINCDDAGVEDYLKIYTELEPAEITDIMQQHSANRQQRIAQTRLAQAVTSLVHGPEAVAFAQNVTSYITTERPIGEASEIELSEIRRQIAATNAISDASIADVLVESLLVSSKSEARRLLDGGAVYINGRQSQRDQLEQADFQNGRLLIRKGKKYKDSVLVELKQS